MAKYELLEKTEVNGDVWYLIRKDGLYVSDSVTKKLEDAAAVEAATEALAKGTEAFAAQRMNRGIQNALSGQHIESI